MHLPESTTRAELAYAAACLAMPPHERDPGLILDLWPFDTVPPPRETRGLDAMPSAERLAELHWARELLHHEITRIVVKSSQ